jgi:hypothetical protein
MSSRGHPTCNEMLLKASVVGGFFGTNLNKTRNRCFENVTKFRYYGKTVTNQNYIHEEINSRLNSGECLIQFSSEYVFSSPI